MAAGVRGAVGDDVKAHLANFVDGGKPLRIFFVLHAVPRALHDILGHKFFKKIRIVPRLIRKTPRPRAGIAHELDGSEKIAPPKLTLAHHDKLVISPAALMPHRFFVVTDMDEARTVEHLRDIVDDVLYRLHIFRRGNAVAPILHPGVVGRREIHLRDGLKAHRAQPVKLALELGDAPSPLNFKFRM